MTDFAIQIENVSKQYRIGAQQRLNKTFRETLTEMVVSRLRPSQSTRYTIFMALQDVSFNVQQGEIVGLIGRNGAGKSTLLKILSRITMPTTGQIMLNGRIGSLLEVGTGFHPELTGRENVLMNGAILGMKRSEITQKFDEIVDFADIAKFIDTPVKHYSSGMYLRLAFSVAAHLQTEILLVDEVLAVGDLNFQRKCLEKMEAIGDQGRTVIFVSHNLAAVKRLCTRAILLEGGQVREDGATDKVINTYMSTGIITSAERRWNDEAAAPQTDYVRMAAVRVCDTRGKLAESFDIVDPIRLEIEYEVLKPGKYWAGYMAVQNEEDVVLFLSGEFSEDHIKSQPVDFVGRRVAACIIPGNLLAEGTLTIGAGVYAFQEAALDFIFEFNVVSFRVSDSMSGSSARGVYTGVMPGVMRPLLDWHTRELVNEFAQP